MKIYQQNIKKYESEELNLQKTLSKISWLRLIIFVVATAVLITFLSNKMFTAFFLAVPISVFAFGVAITRYNKIAYLKKELSFLKKINEAEILRQQCDLETFDTGEEFLNPKHPYTADLDIFGEHSIFQLINRTTTESGRILLSKWLSKAASNDEIDDRQNAIKELAQKLDWRQRFQASGLHFQNKKSDYFKLLEWVEQPIFLLKNQRIYVIVAIILGILSSLSFFFFIASLDSPNVYIFLGLLAVFLIINYFILKKVSLYAEEIVETSTKNLNTLKGYRTLIQQIETENFQSKKLTKLQALLTKSERFAYQEIDRICKLLEFSHQRPIEKIPLGGNYFYTILNSFFLLDIYLILGTEKWKSRNKAFLKSWSEAVSEFEVINSFAGFCYSNPIYVFPEITDKNNFVHFESLGHPLLNSENRICNDFHSNEDLVIITGSNMAGKSTFLRTVGLNIVLALAGSPCCAETAKVSNLQVFSSMRTQDNLMKGVSSFFAELSRIETMLKLINSNENIYFLLDEMFKGTNSEDRHKGGFSLIHQLSKLSTSGIIATHDIELAKLADTKNLVDNYSFNSEIKDNKMTFNYKLEPHICNDFNASELMRQSGIEILDLDNYNKIQSK